MIHGPGKWALLLWEPQNARPRATSVHLKSLGCSLERVGPLCLVPCEPVSLARDFLPPDSVLRVGFRHQKPPGRASCAKGQRYSACPAGIPSAGPQTLSWVFGSWFVCLSTWREGFQVSFVLQEPLCAWALGPGA